MIKFFSLIFLLITFSANAQESYSSIDSMISHFYQKSDVTAYPWDRKKSNGDVINYTLCHNELFNSKRQQFVVVMCPNMWQAETENRPAPTDIYIVENTGKEYVLIVAEQNVEADFSGLIDIGNDKMAIHLSSDERNPNEEYSQSYSNLSIISGNKLRRIIEWKSFLDNTEFVDPNNPTTRADSVMVENKIIRVDNSNKYVDYYPLTITSVGWKGEKKINKKFRINYSSKEKRYLVPAELNKGF